MKRFLNVIFASLLLFAVLLTFCSADTHAAGVGDTIPDFTLPDGITGEDVNFNTDIKGKSKVIVISFMTTTCSACKNEMTLLSDLAEKHEDIKVYAVSVDLMGKDSVPKYDEHFKFKARYMLDSEFSVPPVFNFTYTPSLLVATKEGKILYLRGGFIAEAADEIVNAVENALK